MKYKVRDLVYFEDEYQKGVGKVVAIDNKDDYRPYLVHSTNIEDGHHGYCEDNDNNWWFTESELKPFKKQVGQKYKILRDDCHNFRFGDIVTLTNLQRDGINNYKSEDEEWLLYDIDHPKCELEFYEDAPSAEEKNMFTLEDLKPGYLVKIRDGSLAHVVNTQEKGLCLNYENGWEELSSYNNDLIFGSKGLEDLDIVEVYDFTEDGYNAHKFEVGDRKLLWKREKNPKKYYLRLRPVVDNMSRYLYLKQDFDTKGFISSTGTGNMAYQTQFTQEEIDNLINEHGLKINYVEQIEVEE